MGTHARKCTHARTHARTSAHAPFMLPTHLPTAPSSSPGDVGRMCRPSVYCCPSATHVGWCSIASFVCVCVNVHWIPRALQRLTHIRTSV